MKRLLSLAIAALMFVFAAFSALAAQEAQQEETVPYVDAEEIFVSYADSIPRLINNSSSTAVRMSLTPLTTLYIAVKGANYAEDFNGQRVICEWNKGGEHASDPRIEYCKVYDESGTNEIGYRYLVAMDMLDSADADMQTLSGEIKLAKRRNERVPTVSLTISLQRQQTPDSESTVLCNAKSFRLSSKNIQGSIRIMFADLAFFDVDVTCQGELDIGCSATVPTNIAERFRGAQIRALTWTKKPFFDYKGRLVVLGSSDEYFYEIRGSELVEITEAYSAEDGGFVVEAHRLEGFLIADRQLDLTAEAAPEPNPPTFI